MDMNRYLGAWLNGAELRRLDGRYEGIIQGVVEKQIRNRFTYTKQAEPVIVFEDGYQLVPNIGMRRVLIEFWGPNTDDWIGRRVEVFLERIERKDKTTGEVSERWEKRIARSLADVAVEFPRRRRAR